MSDQLEMIQTRFDFQTREWDPTDQMFRPTALKAALDDDGTMRFSGVASSTIRDLHGDTMTLSALQDMERMAVGLTMFGNHKYTVPEDAYGRIEEARIVNSGVRDPEGNEIFDLRFKGVFDDENPRAVRTHRSMMKGSKFGVSIGAMIPDGGATRDKASKAFTIDHVVLLEASIVGIPANPRSWVDNAVKSLSAVADDEADEEPALDLAKAELSSEGRGKLPDSAFACPAKRKYPHHTAGGAVDKAHLRNGLARCGDSSNDQCGCAHLRAHAKTLGMGGDEKKSIEELILLALEDGVDESHFANTETVEGPSYAWDWDGVTADAEPEITDAKKPSGHTHPHAHEHGHDHAHFGGIQHSHDHAHTHAHEHGDDHEHVDDKQGYEHDHSHEGAWDENHAHDESDSKQKDLEGEELTKHLAEFNTSNQQESVETPPVVEQQEAGSSAPASEEPDASETVSAEETIRSAESLIEAAEQEAVEGVLRQLIDLTHSLTRELAASVEREQAALTAKAEAERQRDEISRMSTQMMNDTRMILDRIADLPVGRRTKYIQSRDKFAELEGVYSDDFLSVLRSKSNT